jgi:hypothetical protein
LEGDHPLNPIEPDKAKSSPNTMLADFLGIEPAETPFPQSVRDVLDDGGLADPGHPRQQQDAIRNHSALLRRFCVKAGVRPRNLFISTLRALRLRSLMFGNAFPLLKNFTAAPAPVLICRHVLLPTRFMLSYYTQPCS